jgi:integrase/recombinase XerD
MASVWKRKSDKRNPMAKWSITFKGESGLPETVVGFTDKDETIRYAKKLETDARAKRLGLNDPRAERYAECAREPVSKHLDDFGDFLSAKGVTPKHARAKRVVLDRAAKACEWGSITDIDAAGVAVHLKRLKDSGLAARGVNWHRAAICSFAKWLSEEKRLRDNPLVRVPKLDEASGRVLVRRALDDAELAALIAEAECGPERFGLSGPTRAMLYRVAVGTGFRASELASLTVRSFDLRGEPPSVTVEAAYSKRRRRDVQPIRSDLAEALAHWTATMPAAASPWAGGRRHAEMIQADLGAARVRWIKADSSGAENRERSDFLSAHDEAGRVVDFHSLRHTYVTRLARSGVSPKVAQTLARHSTITLTMDRYAHVGLSDSMAALDSLPAFMGVDQAFTLAATGTDGAPPVTGSKRAAPAQRGGGWKGHSGTSGDNEPRATSENDAAQNPLRIQPQSAVRHSEAHGEQSVPGAIRTRDLPLRRRLLYPAELPGHGWSADRRRAHLARRVVPISGVDFRRDFTDPSGHPHPAGIEEQPFPLGTQWWGTLGEIPLQCRTRWELVAALDPSRPRCGPASARDRLRVEPHDLRTGPAPRQHLPYMRVFERWASCQPVPIPQRLGAVIDLRRHGVHHGMLGAFTHPPSYAPPVVIDARRAAAPATGG